MDYLKFYHLDQEPFSNAPITKFYFESDQHAKALLRLNRVVDQMLGLAVLVGEIGTGKTTLARKMLDQLPEEEYEAALLVIIHSGITANWLLRRIAQQLGVHKPANEKLQILSQLYRRLLQIAESGKKAVVLIDEAQMLQTRELMEEFRGLLNLEIPGRKLISFVFFALPDMEDTLKLDPPLLQRVALRYHLDALDEPSCEKYIEHRLKLAGAQEGIFEPEAMKMIYRFSHGIPRLVNTISDNALFEGFILRLKKIPVEVVQNIAVDLGLTAEKKRNLRLVDRTDAEEANPLSDGTLASVYPREDTNPEIVFERARDDDTEDIDSILNGLEDKL